MTSVNMAAPTPSERPATTKQVVRRAATFAALWALLTWGDGWSSWVVGLPAITVVVVLARKLGHFPLVDLNLLETLKFSVMFLVRSLQGGWDVARRALVPSIGIAPRLLEYVVRLPAGLPRLLFAHTISVLPGSLVARIDGKRFTVHVLDGSGDPQADLRALEHDVARLFNIELLGQKNE